MGTGQSVGEGSAEEGIVPKAPGVNVSLHQVSPWSIPLMPFCLGILWQQVIRNSFRHIEANQESIDFKVGSLRFVLGHVGAIVDFSWSVGFDASQTKLSYELPLGSLSGVLLLPGDL